MDHAALLRKSVDGYTGMNVDTSCYRIIYDYLGAGRALHLEEWSCWGNL